MNLNLIGYSIYLLITVVIILHVGRVCYQNGRIYVAQLLPDHHDLCQKINQLLLLGYYLMNIGYCALTLISWEKLQTIPQLIEVIAFKSALIIGIIALLHYLNLYVLTKHIQKLI